MTKGRTRSACPGTGGCRTSESTDSQLRPIGERLARTLSQRARDARAPRLYLSCSSLRPLLEAPGAAEDSALVEVDTLKLSVAGLVLVPGVLRKLRAYDELESAVLADEEDDEL